MNIFFFVSLKCLSKQAVQTMVRYHILQDIVCVYTHISGHEDKEILQEIGAVHDEKLHFEACHLGLPMSTKAPIYRNVV